MYIIQLKTITATLLTAFVEKQLQNNFILSFTVPLLRLQFLSKSLIFIDPDPRLLS